jgi:hypothetical protein
MPLQHSICFSHSLPRVLHFKLILDFIINHGLIINVRRVLLYWVVLSLLCFLTSPNSSPTTQLALWLVIHYFNFYYYISSSLYF